MRLTLPTATVLCALAYGHGYGFDIIEATGLGAGTVYPILRRLEDRVLVRSSWEPAALAQAEGRPPRRNYLLTPEGEQATADALNRYPTLAGLFGTSRGGDPVSA